MIESKKNERKMNKLKNKRNVLLISSILILITFFSWRAYQYYDVPEYMLKRIKAWEEYKDTITLSSNGNDINEQLFEYNEVNYKLHNWKNILEYIREDLGGSIVVTGQYKID